MDFNELFPNVKKPIIGMIHLSGPKDRKVTRALEELFVYQEEGLDGAIVEDYFGSVDDVEAVLQETCNRRGLNLVIGVNVLRDPYASFGLAHTYGARFVQFDSVQEPDLDVNLYEKLRQAFPRVAVLGGIGFKYTRPTGNPLEIDLEFGRRHAEAIVTTGLGTGVETPVSKLELYKRHLGEFHLIIGAGVRPSNAREQLQVADGAIVGSYLKQDGDASMPVDKYRVRSLMKQVRFLRDELK